MKLSKILAVILLVVFSFSACATGSNNQAKDVVKVELSDSKITVNGKKISKNKNAAVYAANDIVYYEESKDFTYGEGTAKDAHSKEEAAAHTVVHITKPGKYSVSGKLTKGQIAVDLGKDAKNDESAKVTLILNGVDITCEVAPAVIFYNVFECGNDDAQTATKEVDTSNAGANVVIADGTVNHVNGSYVERIYKPDSVILNEDKTEVKEAEKLHKYDGAFYSKRSMNINGETKGDGVLNITSENEGLDTEMHLTVNGGIINIKSGNDGINTNEDKVSVTTVNGGEVNIQVTGETGEGDGIDSNGWLVINGGKVTAQACSKSADSGIDSDMGIHINGGEVIATGSMLDRIEDGGQTYAVFNFASKQNGKEKLNFKDKNEKSVLEFTPQNAYSILIYSSSELSEGEYTLFSEDKQLAGISGGFKGMNSGGMAPHQWFENSNNLNETNRDDAKPNFQDREPPKFDGGQKGDRPQGQKGPEGFNPPKIEGEQMPEFNGNNQGFKKSPVFKIQNGANTFMGISYLN